MDIKPIKNISLKGEVRKALKQLITSLGEQKRTRLPGEHDLAERLGVSRITIRDVLKGFEQEGMIYKIQGKGTFINPDALKMLVTLSPAVEFEQAIAKCGYKASVDLIDVSTEPAEERIRLALNKGAPCDVISIKKVFYADKRPVIFCEDVIANALITEQYETKELHRSTFEFLLERGRTIVHHDILDISVATASELPDYGKHYKLDKNKPLLVFRSVYFTAKNEPVMYVKAYFDTNYIKLSLLRKQDVYFTE